MNFVESTESMEFVEKFCKKNSGFEPAISYVRKELATSEPGRHGWQRRSWNWFQFTVQWSIRVSWILLNSLNSMKVPLRKKYNICRGRTRVVVLGNSSSGNLKSFPVASHTLLSIAINCVYQLDSFQWFLCFLIADLELSGELPGLRK